MRVTIEEDGALLVRSSPIRIRRVDEFDSDDIREIESACLADRENEADPVDLADHDPEVWLAFDTQSLVAEPVAFGVLVDRGHDATPDRSGWHLRMTGTLPEYQGRGIQRRMIRARVAFARENGARVIRTYTRPDNAESMRGLMACGFKPYRPDDPYRGEGFVYWKRDLS